ncbi:hypothetical protein B7R25_12100 [Subtercola boreus]|uniref:Uncharacterized protein n=1 Tax=Subtercola boreus TaxID=120213 RepID=A0A3E0WA53_9MICO|nr:hypothetical protein B7R24_12000 [Subtercola boreus]RFA19623.1 hypothetical protein B7R23_11980 [Subtercola boreus]RFA25989.1 hypothetical protein B7R25_12100 [Subtercola boreus]
MGVRLRLTLSALSLAALAVGVIGCSPAEVSPTGIPTPTDQANSEWGSYGNRDDACSAVAGDLLTLALVPKNLALADPGSGVNDIDDVIVAAGTAAPPSVAPNYQQLSALVRSYGVQLAAWSAATAPSPTPTVTQTPSLTLSPTPSPASTPTSPASASPSPSASASPTSAPDRPTFDDTPYTARLDGIKTWLSTTCG